LLLHCPFCNASESERVSAIDSSGKEVLLVMFDCPFFYRFLVDQYRSAEEMQRNLEDWRKKEGDQWLESIGPVMKAREMKNIERSMSGHRSNPAQ
jgi:hypothetical protein